MMCFLIMDLGSFLFQPVGFDVNFKTLVLFHSPVLIFTSYIGQSLLFVCPYVLICSKVRTL